MPQPFVIIGNVVFAGDFASIRLQECDRPFYLTSNMNVQAIAH
jgi:hypothetical protein